MPTTDRRPRFRPAPGVTATAALLPALILAAACGTIMHGSSQQIGISSAPTGAQVHVNGNQLGVTPVLADLKRKDAQLIRVTMEGYRPFEMTLTRSVSGWVWGNLVFGGLIGLAVDAITGGLYKLSPEQVRAEMARAGVDTEREGDRIYVMVTLRPLPGAERIGSLVRE